MIKLFASFLLLLVGPALARLGRHVHPQLQVHQNLKRQAGYNADLTPLYRTQNLTGVPIDHFHNESRYEPHTNATFTNLYWMDTSHYVEGGPVIVHALGEDSYSYDLIWLQRGLLYELAKATGGIAVLWGQRYYNGAYNIMPNHLGYYNLTNLRFHSTEQALADLAYFATHATFSGLEHKNLTAPGTPWIIIGGSYGGVISAFTRIQYPDLYIGGITSSGVSTAFNDNWQFYDVVRRYGPSDCITVQQKLTAIMDKILMGGNKTQITQLKAAFGAETLTSNVAFAGTMANFMGYWQGRYWMPAYNSPFTGPGTFCGNITTQKLLFPKSNTAAARNIIANGGYGKEVETLLHPFLNWAGSISYYYFNEFFCGGETLNECFNDTSLLSAFEFLECSESGQFATGYVPGSPGRPDALPLMSRLVTVEYFLQNCQAKYNTTPVLERYNKYGGVNLSYPNLAISAGQMDIWRPTGPLAEFLEFGVPNPRASNSSSVDQPWMVIADGGHEWDLYGVWQNETTAQFPPRSIKSAHARELAAVQLWLKEWKEKRELS